MNKNEPMNIQGYQVSFMGRDSIGSKIKGKQTIVKDGKNGIIEVVLNSQDIKNIGEFQIAYILLTGWNVSHSTTDIKISVLDGVDG